MKSPHHLLSLVGLMATGLLSTPAVSASTDGPARFLHEVPLTGEGGWDYLTVDAEARRLYVSHASKVMVIDTVSDQVVGEVADTPGVHGIAVAPKLGRGYTSNGRENKVSVFELGSMKTLSKSDTGANPDAILFEPGHGEVYAFNGRGHSATVLPAAGGAAVATITLEGKPEFAQADPAAGRVYVNIEDRNQLDVIDTATHAVVARWTLAPGEEPTGLEIDLVHHRLFAGCGNALIVVLDSADGRQVATIPAGEGIDAVGFDPVLQLVFASNGQDGTVTVAHQDSPDHYTVVQTLPTERGARTLAVDPVRHKLYLASAKFEAPPAGTKQRPKMVPGSFKLLVYGYGP